MAWEVEYYETVRGERPVKNFVDNLPLEAKGKVAAVIDALKEFGTMLGMPHARKLIGTELWELRTGGKNASRILYVVKMRGKFVLLHAFLKKTDKTPERDINLGLKRLVDYRTRLTS